MDLNKKLEEASSVLLARPEGRFFFGWLMLKAAGVLTLSARNEQPMATAFAEGQRNIGLMVLALLESVHEDALLLCRNEWKRILKEVESCARTE